MFNSFFEGSYARAISLKVQVILKSIYSCELCTIFKLLEGNPSFHEWDIAILKIHA